MHHSYSMLIHRHDLVCVGNYVLYSWLEGGIAHGTQHIDPSIQRKVDLRILQLTFSDWVHLIGLTTEAM